MQSLESHRRVFMYMATHDRSALALFIEQFGADLSPDLRAIANFVIGAEGDPGEDEKSAFAFVLRGWRQYYQAKYQAAGDDFLQAWSLREWRSWAAMGMGKVCSDVGEWEWARNWLLIGLRIARAEDDFARMAECHGALGEVFFRCGLYRTAFEQFTLDAALLPPGSGYRGRLLNYQAATLGRMGRFDLAEPQLWSAAYGTLDSDPVSTGYSLASLELLTVLARQRELYKRLLIAEGRNKAKFEPLPRIVNRLVAAFWHLQDEREDLARQSLEDLLTDRKVISLYPVEVAWISSCLERAEPSNGLARHQELSSRCVPQPPESSSDLLMDVIDWGTASIPLQSENRRFERLFRLTELTPENIATFLQSIFL